MADGLDEYDADTSHTGLMLKEDNAPSFDDLAEGQDSRPLFKHQPDSPNGVTSAVLHSPRVGSFEGESVEVD
ncbi:hypothetical protein SARC_07333 [Sphaeroforma arctica JP610]|uniref:Uncharacterized protein n=1 Tax=Sphaeroforma arctica JP610 TaxID=667725 RepID=A0A0L0FU01_9EUKA|nr:hypothetical protein SARC_07333 [Sphaeroforma arctica JP610]KNC80320.1 hypothetical protein SARC_07333 [Sphaeroforma arctica JP610]|eukprot:XP_014154222.1 hypothetical protein SARC_07333 [Sphaeroforma arctica JP610]